MIRRICFTAVPFLLLFSITFSAQAATINVNSLADTVADDGVCTLWEAIVAANNNSVSGALNGECAAGEVALDVIEFAVAGTIQPNAPLDIITSPIHIDGYSAPGAVKNSLPITLGTNAVLTVVIDGVNAGNVPALRLSGAGASGSIIEGLVINTSGGQAGSSQHGIQFLNVPATLPVQIRGNFIGTNSSGTAKAELGGVGIHSPSPVSDIIIGSDTTGPADPAAVNIISGSKRGGLVLTSPTNYRIRGNLIGTDATGSVALANGSSGIYASYAHDLTIANNVISGSTGFGIVLQPATSDIVIEKNRIGTNAAGTSGLPNGKTGLFIFDFSFAGPSLLNVDVVENLVAYNHCVDCSGGIVVGISNSANTVSGIRLTRNKVFSNAGLEIDLGETNGSNDGIIYGVTENDAGDPDTGANTLQNFPVITALAVDSSNVYLSYTFNSEASKAFTLEFFYASTCDDSGHGGAEYFLGEELVNTDGSGQAAGDLLFPLTQVNGFITATATNSDNGTSEFSACFEFTDTTFEDGFETT